MPAVKFAISVPQEVMDRVDRAARKRRWTRSHCIAEVLARAARAQSDAEITRRVNEVFAEPDIVAEQVEVARELQRANRGSGTKW